MIDAVLLTTTRIHTCAGAARLTNASGFLFARDERLFLATSAHVLNDPPSGHQPDRIELELHTDSDNLAAATLFSMPLYARGRSLWRAGMDAGGGIDVAVLEIERAALPAGACYRAFTAAEIADADSPIPIGSPLVVLGYPLGFEDSLHHVPVARQAVLASGWGLRFGGEGLFLTDGRTHRGSSGAPILMAHPGAAPGALAWKLLGVHSSRLDVGTRDLALDEALGLNCAWYADILLTLT
ncbi:MAG: serine protease, partial [Gammaproteobacteria bacterium]